MFSLLSGLLKWLFSKTEVHILVLGLDAAGKTTFLEQSKTVMRRRSGANGPGGVPLDKIPPTVGLNIARIDVESTRVIMWDLGGQTLLRSIWSKYYSEANGLIFVVDSCGPKERFDEAKQVLHGLLSHPELAKVPFLLCTNKQDAMAAARGEDVEIALEFIKGCGSERSFRVQPMSALTGAGVEDAVRWIVDAANAFGPRPLAAVQAT